MIYTIDNPKLVEYNAYFEGKETFTGVVKDKYGTIAYYLNGKLHRTDGPAIEHVSGSKKWYLNDNLHRDNGPAVENVDGTKEWYLNDKIHREDGPAIEWSNGDKAWWLNGDWYGWNDNYTNESWIRFVRLELLK